MLIKSLNKLDFVLKRVMLCCMFVVEKGERKVFNCFYRIAATYCILSGLLKSFGVFVFLSDTQFKINFKKNDTRRCSSLITAASNLYLLRYP
jgi:hypothetical protein